MARTLPPIPYDRPQTSFEWVQFFTELREIIDQSALDHNSLLNLQGGTTNEYNHLSNIELAKAQNAQDGIQWKDEGSALGAIATATAVNFTGDGVTASRTGNEVTVNIPGLAYQEGTWTPSDASGAGLSFTLAGTASYVKIGKLCTATCYVAYPVTANTSNASVGGLPFTIANIGNTQGGAPSNTSYGTPFTILGIANNTRVVFATYSDVALTNANLSGHVVRFSFTYITST